MLVYTRLMMVLALASWAGQAPAATTSSTKSKSKPSSSSKGTTSTQSSGKSKSAPKKETFSKSGETSAAKDKNNEAVKKKEEPPNEPRPAAVSTVSIEEIAGFDQYPKQVQSLVQSALALTHLELRYMYGSHEPSNGGMDCSGTIYHVLHFQGLKDVPRQSDEMAMWVDKKTQLHLTPTAMSFDSPEFDALKPGDLLFWSNTIATTRKLPVTHVMIYLGKLKKDGRRIVFGASDGRSYSGQRRSGVSVFDFSLPKAERQARLHGYGRAPGLMPAEDVTLAAAKAAAPPPVPAPAVVATPSALANTTPKEEASKEVPVATKAPPKPDSTLAAKDEPRKEEPKVADKPSMSSKATPTEEDLAKEEPKSSKTSAETKEEVRKAVTVLTNSAEAKIEENKESVEATTIEMVKQDGSTTGAKTIDTKAEAKREEEPTKAVPSSSKAKSSTPAVKSKTKSSGSGSGSAKKRSTSAQTRRSTPPLPAKSAVGQRVDRAVDSVKRFFR